jgi:type VI secretion system secreted protein VgrG
MTVNESNAGNQIDSKIVNNKEGVGKTETVHKNYNIKLEEALNIQMKMSPKYWADGKWVNATREQVRKYLDPNNYNDGDNNYQFLDLSAYAGVSEEEMNNYLSNKGILCEKGSVFIEAAKKYGVSEVYLAAHTALETGNGSSKLATGVEVNGVKVYNMFGIHAFDSDPIGAGSKYAYEMGWTTPEKSIEGGAKWISEKYINNSSYKQNNLYKMRWNPSSPGKHQYATDVRWAANQIKNIKNMYDKFPKANLKFDIPIYKNK